MRINQPIAAIILALSMASLVPAPAIAQAAAEQAAARASATLPPKYVTPRPLAAQVPAAGKISPSVRLPASPAAPARATIPAGDSLVSVPGGGSANLRNDACLPGGIPPQNPWSPYDPCGVNAQAPDGSYVIMRCWTDTVAVPQYSNSPRWFFVTRDTGNPETNVSGFIYSAFVTVASQVRTPNCDTTDYALYYPYQPSDATISIANRPSADLFTISLNDIALGTATLYCHVGAADAYPTGGTVVNLGQFSISTASYGDNFTIPVCGTGNQWIGIIASNGIIRYSNQVTIGSGAPPPPPPAPGYLGGIGGSPLTFSTTSGYEVGSSITVTGYPAENFGQTDVTVQSLALTATSPNGDIEYLTCYSNLTVAPGQIVYCPGTFTPDVAGSWELNLDWQGSDASWHDLYEPLDIQIAAAPPTPANDDFASARDITGMSTFSGTNVGATAQPGEPDHYLGLPPKNSVWFKFTALKSGRAWVTLNTKTDITALAAYTGQAVNHLTRLASWDALGTEAIAFKVTEGNRYYFAVDDDYGFYPGTSFSGSVAIKPVSAPANNDFAHAQPLAARKVYTAEFTNATVQPGEPAAWPGDRNYGSVWYSVRPTKNITLTFNSPSSSDDVDVALFTGKSLKSLKRLSYGWLGKKGHSWTVTLSAGHAYYIAVDNYHVPPDRISGIPPALRFEMEATVKPRP